MKVNEHWLRQFVDPTQNITAIAETLTAAGLEVDAVHVMGEDFNGVVIGEITAITPHPTRTHLNVCTVNVGKESLTIVCGAENVFIGAKVAAACVGAQLPHMPIGVATFDAVTSAGMLCAMSELGLIEEKPTPGILILDSAAPVGTDLRSYLALPDTLLDINLTPNRGDCLSILGVARECAALTQAPLQAPNTQPVEVTITEQLAVTLQSSDCPLYMGRVIRGIDNTIATPMWMKERLRRVGGSRSISLAVDITNYVMLELGQPLHAFDLAKTGKHIYVRDAKPGETLELLDGTVVTLDPNTLVIADEHQALAMGGVKGGAASGMSLETRDVFLESAHFLPQRIAGKTRQYPLSSDGAYRFERGVDPALVEKALERASALLLEIAGGQAGPITVMGSLPAVKPAITLRLARINRLLGVDFPAEQVAPLLTRLGFQVTGSHDVWQVTAPSFRFDIALEADLIEELARLYGYQHLPAQLPHMTVNAIPASEAQLSTARLRALCVDRGYNELITYSFVDSKVQQLLMGPQEALMLLNPMASQMDAMRLGLLPGLLQALCYNQNRQQSHMRLFELGLCFLPEADGLVQRQHIAGVLSSQQADKHWRLQKREVDFYDLKGDVEALLALTARSAEFVWQQGKHPALHPGQAAALLHGGKNVGWLGQLHPQVAKALDIKGKVFVFELQLDALLTTKIPHYAGISKFPLIRRDLALLVDRQVAAQDLCTLVAQQSETLLLTSRIFDVYEGEGIAPDKKSVAMEITIQSIEKTLVDAEINALMNQVIEALKQTYHATIRD